MKRSIKTLLQKAKLPVTKPNRPVRKIRRSVIASPRRSFF